MPDAPIPLNDDDLSNVVGGAGALPSGKLSDPTADIYNAMKLYQEMAQETRNSAREVRTTELQAQTDALKHAANDIRSAAEEKMQSALMAGTVSVAGSLMQQGMGAANLIGSIKGASHDMSQDLSGPKGQIGPSTPAIDHLHAGASGIISGIGSIAGAGMTFQAAEQDAKRAETEAAAKVSGQQQQHANDMMQAMQDVIRGVRDKLSSMEQSQQEINRGIVRKI